MDYSNEDQHTIPWNERVRIEDCPVFDGSAVTVKGQKFSDFAVIW